MNKTNSLGRLWAGLSIAGYGLAVMMSLYLATLIFSAQADAIFARIAQRSKEAPPELCPILISQGDPIQLPGSPEWTCGTAVLSIEGVPVALAFALPLVLLIASFVGLLRTTRLQTASLKGKAFAAAITVVLALGPVAGLLNLYGDFWIINVYVLLCAGGTTALVVAGVIALAGWRKLAASRSQDI